MSEKRFIISKNVGNRFPTGIIDTKEQHLLWVGQVVDCLNEQQDTINKLSDENEQLRKQCFELEKDYLIETSDISDKIYLKDEIRELKKKYGVIGDEPFEFNKNCAKPYEIRSVSTNGIIRVGKKNSRVSYRMKDVREISAELPPFEDFNREIFQQIKNKFHTKFDNDVIGRIIYNIYIGTFEEYI